MFSSAPRTAQLRGPRINVGRPEATPEIACSPYEDFRTDWIEGCRSLRRNLAAYEEAGVSWLMIEPSSRTLSVFRDDLSSFADEMVR